MLPVVRVDDLADDGEPEPGALRLGREERIEHLVGHVRRHPGPVVGHLDQHRVAPVAAVVQPRSSAAAIVTRPVPSIAS